MEEYQSKEVLSEAYAELFEATAILDQAHKKVTPSECAKEQNYITKEERAKFQDMLERHKVLFNGELGLYPHQKIHLKLNENTVPVHKKPYPVPFTRQAVFCWVLRNLVKDGVLKPCGLTNWASPTFIIPKLESNTVRWVSNFRELNKVLERAKYPILRI